MLLEGGDEVALEQLGAGRDWNRVLLGGEEDSALRGQQGKRFGDGGQ